MICATNVCSQNYKETLFGNFDLILAIFSLHILAPLNWIVQRRQWSGNGVSLLPLFLEKIPTKSPFLLMIISLILSKDTCKAQKNTQGVTNIRIFGYILIFSDTNIGSYNSLYKYIWIFIIIIFLIQIYLNICLYQNFIFVTTPCYASKNHDKS